MQNEASAVQQRYQPSARQAAGVDLVQKVAGYMVKHMISGLPRNYELVHEALAGHHPALDDHAAIHPHRLRGRVTPIRRTFT